MAIDVISAEHVFAADRREAARAVAHQYLLARAEARRGTRVGVSVPLKGWTSPNLEYVVEFY
jgi:hypothetical protein